MKFNQFNGNLLNIFLTFFVAVILLTGCEKKKMKVKKETQMALAAHKTKPEVKPFIDTLAYQKQIENLRNQDIKESWKIKHPYPTPGAVLPFKRVISYYGNLYSKKMGILGELPKNEMLAKLKTEVDKWTKADSTLPAVPALHYIAVTAQHEPGKAGKYRLRMPFHQIDTVLKWAAEINGLVFIDVQVGQSTLQDELPKFEKYLALPQVHLGIDAEFSMKNGQVPGGKIGTSDAADINYASHYLAEIVKKYKIPSKMLIVHRFTEGMITNYKKIELLPEVQIVMAMDGWGSPAKKVFTYRQVIYDEPVQFAGFKIFYKHDTEKVGEKQEMQPGDVLKLTPRPVFIQYQ